jgi:hypothetical protein
MLIRLPLSDMSLGEKLQVMEEIWEDLSRIPDFESPSWHQDVLEKTEARIASGKAKFVDWEKAKAEIRRQLE